MTVYSEAVTSKMSLEREKLKEIDKPYTRNRAEVRYLLKSV